MPDIDEICKLLDCTPGEAPGRVRELLYGKPASEPPDSYRYVIVQLDSGNRHIGWYEYPCDVWHAARRRGVNVVRWWELPSVPEVE